jgi:hypothetical protein
MGTNGRSCRDARATDYALNLGVAPGSTSAIETIAVLRAARG